MNDTNIAGTSAEISTRTQKPNAETQAELDARLLRESHLRTLLKTLSWRIIATMTTIIIAYFIFGNVAGALAVGGVEFFAKMVIYYVHERAWQIAPRGTVRKLVESDHD